MSNNKLNYSVKSALSIISFIFLSQPVQAETPQKFSIFTRFSSEIYSEPQPVKSFVNHFDAKLTNGDSAFTYNQFEIGVGFKNFTLGVQSRYDYSMEFAPDTAEYTYLDKNNLPFEQRNYRYYLRAKNITSNGVFVSYQFNLPEQKITITPKVAIFASTHYQDGLVDGDIFADQGQGALTVDYYYSNDLLFKSFNLDSNPSGLGVSLAIDSTWQVNEQLQLSFSIKDLYHSTTFKNSAFAKGTSTDKPFQQQTDGEINSSPTIALQTALNGNEKSHTLTLPSRLYASARYQITRQFAAQLSVKKYQQDLFTQLRGIWQFNDHFSTFAGYQTKSNSWLLGLSSRYFSLSLETDSTNIDNAYYANINAQLNYQF
jgi:hypothetical protein